ncbi:hypothetical protein BDN71DRAFT_1052974 [Pleurotus eryngii]|uniref:Uncharacterized protein n=1 Tax=Pleurotus eryngii TaxID=5323 RepID=A0A9P6D5T6_PLEER|nr:hypothetical protein BDN71DRAFT_1052974 [Pleurotus eryngii]
MKQIPAARTKTIISLDSVYDEYLISNRFTPLFCPNNSSIMRTCLHHDNRRNSLVVGGYAGYSIVSSPAASWGSWTTMSLGTTLLWRFI